MTKVLILTAGYGEGHNAAARHLAAAFAAEAGPGTALQTDLFALGAPRLNALSRSGYLAAINRAPRAWSAFFAWIDRAKPFPQVNGLTVPCTAPDALVAAAVRLVTDRPLCERLRTNARAALEHQSWENVIGRFEADLSAVAAQPRPT